MPQPRHSNSLEPDKAYAEALSAARLLPRPRLEDDTVIAYGRGGLAAAYTLFLALSHSGARAMLLRPMEAAVHVLPYRETGPLVIYTRDPRDLRSLNAAMAGVHLGLEVYLVAPELHPALEEQLESLGVERIRVPRQAPPLLTMVLASLHWAPKMMGAREERLRREIGELDSALDWLKTTQAAALGVEPPRLALYTPAALPGAAYHAEALGGDARPLEDAAGLGPGARAVAYTVGVERHGYKDIILQARTRRVELVEVPIDTDPVTAAAYSVMAAMLLTGRVL